MYQPVPRCKSFLTCLTALDICATTAAILAAMLFALGVLCFFAALFFMLCCRSSRNARQSDRTLQDAESSSHDIHQRMGGRPASMYRDRKLGDELPQPYQRHHRVAPLSSTGESREVLESITPTVSEPISYDNDENRTCTVRITVTPPSPVKGTGGC